MAGFCRTSCPLIVLRMFVVALIVAIIMFDSCILGFVMPPNAGLPYCNNNCVSLSKGSRVLLSPLGSQKDDTNSSDSTRNATNKYGFFEPTISPYDVDDEIESSRKLFQRLSILDTIGKAGNAVLFSFVGLGILLNVLGYAYIPSGDTIWKLKIGTLQERQFQLEINKSVKEQKIKLQQQKEQQQNIDEALK